MGICLKTHSRIMEEIQNKLEILIDDILTDENLTKDEIHNALVMLKTEIEDYNLRQEEGRSLEWEDLD